MKRILTIRLFIVILVITVSVLLFSYVRANASREEDPTCETGKCPSALGIIDSYFIERQALIRLFILSTLILLNNLRVHCNFSLYPVVQLHEKGPAAPR
jgi:hypothetical protein